MSSPRSPESAVMSPAARSIFAYSIYLFAQGAVLLALPNVALRLFGLPETTEIWVRIVGMTILFFAIYYVIAARNEFRPFFVASVATRLSVPVIFCAFIVAGLAAPNILLFTPLDILFAAWTWSALRTMPAMARPSA
jgi:hypothetical protein